LSGLVVVTGPAYLNSVPLRRVSPGYLIATRIRIGLGRDKASSILYENRNTINDSLFAKAKGRLKEVKKKLGEEKKAEKKTTKTASEGKDSEKRKLKIVLKHPRTSVRIEKRAKRKERVKKTTEKKLRVLSEKSKQRKSIQKAIDKALKSEIKRTPYLKDYLSARFSLTRGQYPHQLVF